jgi:hypothetical protein
MSLRGTGHRSSRLPPAVRALQSHSGSDRVTGSCARQSNGIARVTSTRTKVLSGSQFAACRAALTFGLLTPVSRWCIRC